MQKLNSAFVVRSSPIKRHKYIDSPYVRSFYYDYWITTSGYKCSHDVYYRSRPQNVPLCSRRRVVVICDCSETIIASQKCINMYRIRSTISISVWPHDINPIPLHVKRTRFLRNNGHPARFFTCPTAKRTHNYCRTAEFVPAGKLP